MSHPKDLPPHRCQQIVDVFDAHAAEREAVSEWMDLSERRAQRIIELATELNKARDEVEALRKDADRYQWLRDKSDAVHQFYLSVPLWLAGVRFRPQDVDSAIDAMSKGDCE